MPSSKALGAPLAQWSFLLHIAVTNSVYFNPTQIIEAHNCVDVCETAEMFISKALTGAGEAPVSMRPYLAESRLLARPDNSCQRLEASACLLKNEGHGAAGVTSGLAR